MALCWLAAQSALSPCSARLPGEIEQAWPTGQQMPLSSSVQLAHRRSKIAAVWNRFEREDATLRTVPQITTFTAVVDSPLSVRLNWDVPQPCVDSQGVACTGFELLVQDQEHEFGRPFQLGHHDNSDSPSDAMLTTFPLEPGDFIIMGSDGLWDNLSEVEILELIEDVFKGGCGSAAAGMAQSQSLMNKASREIVSAAYHASMDKRRTTPYSLAATEFFDMVYSGGKKDDITAVIVNVG